MLADHGAVWDLAQSLAEGLVQHVANMQRRLPHTTIVLQLDEPSLPAVLAARIRTASGFGNLRAPSPRRRHGNGCAPCSLRPSTPSCTAAPPTHRSSSWQRREP